MTHDERVFYHTYTTCEGIAEHAERIVALEELCADMWVRVKSEYPQGGFPDMGLIEGRMLELGVEVP